MMRHLKQNLIAATLALSCLLLPCFRAAAQQVENVRPKSGEVGRKKPYMPILDILFKDGSSMKSRLDELPPFLAAEIAKDLKLEKMTPADALIFERKKYKLTFYHSLKRRDMVVTCNWSFRNHTWQSLITVSGMVEQITISTRPTDYLTTHTHLDLYMTKKYTDGTSESGYVNWKWPIQRITQSPHRYLTLNRPAGNEENWFLTAPEGRRDAFVTIIYYILVEDNQEHMYVDHVFIDNSRPTATDMIIYRLEVDCSHINKEVSCHIEFNQSMNTRVIPVMEMKYAPNSWLKLKLKDVTWKKGPYNLENATLNLRFIVPKVDNQVFLHPWYRVSGASGLGENDFMEKPYVHKEEHMPLLILRPVTQDWILLGKAERVYAPGEFLKGRYNVSDKKGNYRLELYHKETGNDSGRPVSGTPGCSTISWFAPKEEGSYLLRLFRIVKKPDGQISYKKIAETDFKVKKK